MHWTPASLDNQYERRAATRLRRAIPTGGGEGTSTRLSFLTPGLYWYHPHIREDYEPDMGRQATSPLSQPRRTTGHR